MVRPRDRDHALDREAGLGARAAAPLLRRHEHTGQRLGAILGRDRQRHRDAFDAGIAQRHHAVAPFVALGLEDAAGLRVIAADELDLLHLAHQLVLVERTLF